MTRFSSALCLNQLAYYAVIACGQFVNLYFFEAVYKIGRVISFFTEKYRYRAGDAHWNMPTIFGLSTHLTYIVPPFNKVAFSYYYIFRCEKDITNHIFLLIFYSKHLQYE